MTHILEVENLSVHFAGFKAVNNCSLKVKKGSITALIGPNGAGKTTLFQLICGNHKPTSGRVLFKERSINNYSSFERFHLGISRTFQIAHEFHRLTVLENLMVVPAGQTGENLFSNWLAPNKVKKQEKELLAKAYRALEFLEISHLANQLAGQISGGQKKLLELGRTMMAEPDLILLDEVAAGVNRTLLRKLENDIVRLNQGDGYTFLLIEHDMEMVNKLADTVICMAEGSVLTQGSFKEVVNNRQVQDAYLGEYKTKK